MQANSPLRPSGWRGRARREAPEGDVGVGRLWNPPPHPDPVRRWGRGGWRCDAHPERRTRRLYRLAADRRHRARSRDARAAPRQAVRRPRAAESSGRGPPAPCRRSAACHSSGSSRTSARRARPSSRPGRALWQTACRAPIPESPSPAARRPIGGRRAARSRRSRRAPAECRPSRRCRPRSACATSCGRPSRRAPAR